MSNSSADPWASLRADKRREEAEETRAAAEAEREEQRQDRLKLADKRRRDAEHRRAVAEKEARKEQELREEQWENMGGRQDPWARQPSAPPGPPPAAPRGPIGYRDDYSEYDRGADRPYSTTFNHHPREPPPSRQPPHPYGGPSDSRWEEPQCAPPPHDGRSYSRWRGPQVATRPENSGDQFQQREESGHRGGGQRDYIKEMQDRGDRVWGGGGW